MAPLLAIRQVFVVAFGCIFVLVVVRVVAFGCIFSRLTSWSRLAFDSHETIRAAASPRQL